MNGPEPLGLLLDQAQDKIALLDDDGRFTYVNGAAERILGFEPTELVGENVFEYVHPDDRETARRAFRDVIDSDEFAQDTIEYRHRASDGSWVWLSSRMSNLSDDGLDGYVVSSHDITDRVRAERERAETASSMREIATVSSDVLWMFDGDWSELRFVNPAYEEIYGAPVDELEGDQTTFLDSIHPEDVPTVEAAMERLSDGTPTDIEFRVNPDENYNRWVWAQAEPIVDDGEVVRITGFNRDVTDRRRRECQLVVMDNLLRHNLRNDLNVILGRAEYLEADLPEAAEHTAVIRRVGERLLETAAKEREIIDLITAEGETKWIELRAAIADCVDTVRDRHPTASIEVSTPEAVVVDGRPELRAAVIELLENAVRHADKDGSTVRIALHRTPAGARIVVRDDHASIPAADADVLTGDHDMTNVYHSSGLGLWLVHWAVDLSDGSIAVMSGSEGGNEITITLPRTVD
jgi:PAS domain S-box-containing protein